MKHSHFIFTLFENMVDAVAALNVLPVETQVLEFGERHKGGVVMLVSSSDKNLVTHISGKIDFVHIENPRPEFLKGYFKLLDTRVKKNLLIIESPLLSKVFETADHLLKNSSFELIEISRAPGAAKHATAYLANGDEALAEKLVGSGDLLIQLVKEPSAHILKHFNI